MLIKINLAEHYSKEEVFKNIDFQKVILLKDLVDIRKNCIHAGTKKSIEFLAFKKQFDKKFFNNSVKGITYPFYVRMIATIFTLEEEGVDILYDKNNY